MKIISKYQNGKGSTVLFMKKILEDLILREELNGSLNFKKIAEIKIYILLKINI
jgi:hypothetical protein